MRCGRWVQLRARSFCFRRTITGIDLDDQASRFYVDKAAATTLDEDAQVGLAVMLCLVCVTAW